MVRFSVPNRRAQARGFTLVELMIVVVVIAILSALAVYGVRKYILASKTSEAVEMLGAIRAAQEAYKADTFSYRATVGGASPLAATIADYTNFYPSNTVLKREKMQWGATDLGGASLHWRALGVSASSPVSYIYGCAAGTGTTAPAGLGSLTIAGYPGAATGAPWYLCKAAADLDNNNANGEWAYSSFADEIAHTKNEE